MRLIHIPSKLGHAELHLRHLAAKYGALEHDNMRAKFELSTSIRR